MSSIPTVDKTLIGQLVKHVLVEVLTVKTPGICFGIQKNLYDTTYHMVRLILIRVPLTNYGIMVFLMLSYMNLQQGNSFPMKVYQKTVRLQKKIWFEVSIQIAKEKKILTNA